MCRKESKFYDYSNFLAIIIVDNKHLTTSSSKHKEESEY